MPLRRRIESFFECFGRGVARHRLLAAAGALLATAALGSAIPRMQTDTSAESFLRLSSEARARYDAFRREFGRDDAAVVLIETPDPFEAGFLERLRAFHRDLESGVPHLDEVTSLVNARSTRGEGDRLIVEDLLEDWPETDAEREAVRRRAFSNPVYRGALLSEDGRATTVWVKPDTWSGAGAPDDLLAGFSDELFGGAREPLTEEETGAFAEALLAVVARHQHEEFPLQVAGNAVMNAHSSEKLRGDVARFGAISTLLVGVLLFALFRRVAGVVLPLLVVGCSLVATQGLMVLLGIPLSVPLQILPSLLLTVGVCGAVHILVVFFQALDRGSGRTDAIAFALSHSGLAVFMASLTTALGLLSFATVELAPVGDVGIVAPIGVMLAFLYVIVLLPALLALVPLRPAAGRRPAARLARVMVEAGAASARRPGRVVGATAVVALVGLAGVLQLRFGHNLLEWLPEDDPLRVGTERFDATFGGVASVEAVVDTGEVNGLHEPGTLRRLEDAVARAESLRDGPLEIAKALSLVDVVKETHQALNENDPSDYRIPDDRRLVAQELLLFENSGSDDLADVADPLFRRARISMRAPWVNAVLYPPFLVDLEEELSAILGPDARLHVTGLMAILSESLTAIVTSMARSYLFAIAVITPTMILMIGSLWRGAVAMIPNLLPVFLTLGLMGWAGIPLDGSNLMIGSVVLGLAVDDTIHFMHKFQRYQEDGGDVDAAVRHTLGTTGVAMLTTTLVLAAGFASFLFAYMYNAVQLGLLAAFATVVAFLADVLLAPALMRLAIRIEGIALGEPERGLSEAARPSALSSD